LKSLNEQLVEQGFCFYRIHHISNFIDAEFFRDHCELCFEYLSDTMLDGVFEHKIDCPHNMGLPNTIHSTNPLLNTHRIPRHIEVDDDVAKLKVKALAAGIRRD